MSKPPTSTGKTPMEEAALAMYYHVAQQLKAGKTQEDIITELEAKGIKRETAHIMLERLAQSQRNVEARDGKRNVAIGMCISLISGGLAFGWLGLPYDGGLPVLPALAGLGIGLYWLARGALQILHARL